jgi:DNA-binding transcriptional ArsR family regulator
LRRTALVHAAARFCPRLACSTVRLTIADDGRRQGRMDQLDAVFAALADPTRRAILAMLLEDDMAVTDVAEPFEMSLAAISKHLAVLAAAGLISQEKRGRVKWCKLEPDGLRAASVWMQGFGQFEPVHLDAFERFLAAELGTGAD